MYGRIVVCGVISSYSKEDKQPSGIYRQSSDNCVTDFQSKISKRSRTAKFYRAPVIVSY